MGFLRASLFRCDVAYSAPLLFLFFPNLCLASGAKSPVFIDYFHLILHSLGVSPTFAPVAGGVLTLIVSIALGFTYRAAALRAIGSNDLLPSGKLSAVAVVESIMEFLYDLAKEQFGEHFRDYLPLIASLFVFILFSNLSGLIPGFPPTTESFSANLVMGLVVFAFYNYAGIKEHGFAYGKQFMGPFLILAPMFVLLELISHAARPLSLSFRLTANIFGDHLLLGVFSGMVPVLVPAFLLFFGLLVACIQSFVFTMLTSIYISMAVSHDH